MIELNTQKHDGILIVLVLFLICPILIEINTKEEFMLDFNDSEDQESVPSLFTNQQYLTHLFAFFKQKQKLAIFLEKEAFVHIEQYLTKLVWPHESLIQLIILLESYITFSIQIQEESEDETNYIYEVQNFGKQFGKKVKDLLANVELKNNGILRSLEFFQKAKNCDFELQLEREKKKMVLTAHQIQQISTYLPDYSCFYLFQLFMKSCKKLENLGEPIDSINKKLQQVITFLNFEVVNTPETEEERAVAILFECIKGEQYKKLSSIKLVQPENLYQYLQFSALEDALARQNKLQLEIMRYVQTAKKQYHYYETLLSAICKKRGRNLKINLKLESRQNKVSLQRIKQKILFKKLERSEKLPYQTLDEMYRQEKIRAKDKIREKLSYKNSILMKIPDLLRARCIFSSIEDINSTYDDFVMQIQRRINKGQQIQIVEIDNRLNFITNDIVLKIKIRSIVCQLQMILSYNKSKNHNHQIYHKLYEINRSKVFSTLSMLYYYNEKITNRYVGFLIKMRQAKKELITQKIDQIYSSLLENLSISKDLSHKLGKSLSHDYDKFRINDKMLMYLTIDEIFNSHKVESLLKERQKRTQQFFIQLNFSKLDKQMNEVQPKAGLIQKQLNIFQSFIRLSNQELNHQQKND